MSSQSLKNIGKAGINSDIPAWELPIEFISGGVNFRAANGSISPFSGSVELIPSSVDHTAGLLKFMRTKKGSYWIKLTQHGIYSAQSDADGWKSIGSRDYSLPAGAQYEWSADQLGQLLVINNPNSWPEYILEGEDKTIGLPFKPNPNYDPADSNSPAFLTWEDEQVTCKVIRAHKNFLIGLNLNDNPNGYRISHPAEENAVPFTWDDTDRSSIAVKAQLGSDGGEIIDGRSLRDNFIIYSKDSIDVITFNPNSEFYWQRTELSSTVGLLNTNCLTEVKGIHYLIVDGDIVVNDGSTIQSILYDRLQTRFNARTNEFTKLNSFVARNDLLKEIWFCIPEGQDADGNDQETANIAFVYNWKDNSWQIRTLPEDTVSIDFGHSPATIKDLTKGTWAGISGSWASQTRPWGTRQTSPTNDILASLNIKGDLLDIDPRDDIDQNSFDMVIERTDYPIGEQEQIFTAINAYPTVSGAQLSIQIGAQKEAAGPVKWGHEQTFIPGSDRKLDFRVTGSLLAWRIKSIDKGRFKFSGMQLVFSDMTAKR